MPDKFNLSKLAQEMVVSRLKERKDAPAIAAEIAKSSIVAAVQGARSSGQPSEETVEEICLGIMQGMLLTENDMSKAAVSILRCMAEASQALRVESSEMM